jgi:hypothetical protein
MQVLSPPEILAQSHQKQHSKEKLNIKPTFIELDIFKTNNVKPEAILAEHTPEVRVLAESLRQLVLETVPDAIELAYPVWHGLGYRHPKGGYFVKKLPLAAVSLPESREVKVGLVTASAKPVPGNR